MLKLLASFWHDSQAQPSARFKLRGLTGLEYLEFQDLVIREQGEPTLASMEKGEKQRLNKAVCAFVLSKGLLDWDSVCDENDEPIRFTPEAGENLHFVYMAELTGEILTKSQLTDDQLKNLLLQLKSQQTRDNSTARDANGGDTATPETPHPSKSSLSPGSSKAERASKPCRPRTRGT